MKGKCTASILTAIVMAGCIGGEPEPRPPAAKQPAAKTAVNTPTKETPKDDNLITSPAPVTPTETRTAPDQPKTPTPRPTAVPPRSEDDQWATQADLDGLRQKAAVGMGSKGRGYGGDIITYPVATYFRVRERIGLDQIKHAMQLYKAMHNHYPRTQEEFRKEIIKPRAIRLPTLPGGRKFYYDPEKGELGVVQPR